MPDINPWLQMLFVVWCVAIFFYDTLARRVPNNLLLMAMALQFGCFAVAGVGLSGISPLKGLEGFVAGLVYFLPLYALRVMAAGDVKFFAVLGLLLGHLTLLPVVLMGSLLAGIHAVLFCAMRAGMLPALHIVAMRMVRWQLYQRILQKRGNRVGIPYAAYLACGAVLVITRGA